MSDAPRVAAAARAGSEAATPRELLACDLVMKGGITSGVVYPKLIGRLAREYEFKSIGGTSAGAIAAAACAAAEVGRQSERNPDSFEDLSRLSDELGKGVGKPLSPMLFHLFQPDPSLRTHFAVLEGALNAPTAWAAVAGALWALMVQYWTLVLLAGMGALAILMPAVMGATGLSRWAALRTAVVLLACWMATVAFAGSRSRSGRALAGGVLALTVSTIAVARAWAVPWDLAALLALACAVAVPLAIALAAGLVSWRFGITLLRGLHGNGYGICSGRTVDDRPAAPGLTDWFADYLDNLAGRPAGERPLTFGDLWGAPFHEHEIAADPEDRPLADRLVNLQVVTTAVSQQMCHSIPFRDGTGTFYYDPLEWARLFPPRVMSWLARVSEAQSNGETVRTRAGALVLKLPSNGYLPVVVAVRMSLSFPVLLSAVPLYARDVSLAGSADRGPIKRIWFSDGGISSNLPLHFFDAPLPGRPTFAVNLKEEHPAHPIDPTRRACDQDGRVYLPKNNNAGRALYWPAPADETPLGLLRFLWSIVYTMQNWRDEILFPYPGYRDRIVQISQLPDEGGLNLKMPKKNIDALSDAGECAGARLAERFDPFSTAPERGGWENHKQIRLRTFLGVVEEVVTHPRVSETQWDEVVERCLSDGHYTHAEAALAHDALRTLRDLGARIGASHGSLQKKAPRPRPTMRIAPRI
jgi:predicted acylesterase/phospholipase RssA